ncbi:MAG: L-serine ammonia-lyase, iron-sulfur-dependent, subunit alpha [Clostridia bacterium]|nr:L-serine ammonia-lyase, iron-sulfur-dependent, subunit alpha [Clostridia bacterium]
MSNLEAYLDILNEELRPALGCTEPIAVAFCAAKAKEALGSLPDHVDVYCSGNIIKNVKAVTVPNSNGQKGIEVAAMLGIVGGRADKELEVLNSVTEEDIKLADKLISEKIINVFHEKDVDNLYVRVELSKGTETASCIVKTKHTFVSEIKKNGKVIFKEKDLIGDSRADKSCLNLKDIYNFAKTVDVEKIKPLLKQQVEYNYAIAQVGLKENYGANVGKTLLEVFGEDNVMAKAAATAAAGSDARMNGCALPVVINSGSGNQGIAVSMPLYVYAKEKNVDEENLYRALALANLVSLLQKRYIGDLSAYCGACCAGCSSICGIAFLEGQDYETIGHIIINTASTIGGMVCDGAKSSCAAKIAASVMSGFVAYAQAKNDRSFKPGEGMIVEDIEQTIANFGRMGREGMKSTDEEILQIMLGN